MVPSRAAAKRERQRLNAGLGRSLAKVGGAIVLIWLAAAIVGFLKPIGMLGFFFAVVATVAVAGMLLARGGRQAIAAPAPSTDLPNGAMVDRFDFLSLSRSSRIARAGAGTDRRHERCPPLLKKTLERVDTLDPSAQDARRLMSIHLPGLHRALRERARRPIAASRTAKARRSMSVSSRASLRARGALVEVSQQLARSDLAAFETQGRFIESRYGDQGIESEDASTS